MYSSEVHDAYPISLLDLWIIYIFTHTHCFLCPQKTQRIELFAGCCNQLRPRSLEPSMSARWFLNPFGLPTWMLNALRRPRSWSHLNLQKKLGASLGTWNFSFKTHHLVGFHWILKPTEPNGTRLGDSGPRGCASPPASDRITWIWMQLVAMEWRWQRSPIATPSPSQSMCLWSVEMDNGCGPNSSMEESGGFWFSFWVGFWMSNHFFLEGFLKNLACDKSLLPPNQ